MSYSKFNHLCFNLHRFIVSYDTKFYENNEYRPLSRYILLNGRRLIFLNDTILASYQSIALEQNVVSIVIWNSAASLFSILNWKQM